MLSIYTRTSNPLKREFWKWAARAAMRKYTGPDAVRDSLLRGLRELHIAYELNPARPRGKVALVLSGVVALQEALALKKSGALTKLAAGPNIVVDLRGHNGLILDEVIDYVLVPSVWVADFWKRKAPEIADRIRVWPAGVASGSASVKTGQPVIYDKMNDPGLLSLACSTVAKSGMRPRVFFYGSFRHADYLDALRNAPYLVYLSRSESQGLALQEAWARDVPTFVNKSTRWEHGPYRFEAEGINAPYLTDATGGIFATEEELASLVARANKFHPKAYCDEHLSDSASVDILLSLL